MKISYGKCDLENYNGLTAVFAFEDNLEIKGLDKRYGKACKSRAFSGKLLQNIQLQDGEKTILVIGLGKRNEFDCEWLRRAAVFAYKFAQNAKIPKINFILPAIGDEKCKAQSVCEGALIASYRLDAYKTKDEKEEKARIEPEIIVCGKDATNIEEGIVLGKIMGNAQNFVRELDEKPGNIINPAAFAEEAKKLAKEYGLRFGVMKKPELEKKGMNGILAVGKGSASEPMLVEIEYDGGKGPLYCVVGKGITFDSGGISLKPGKNMDEMKYDKSGACTVLGVLKSAAELKLPIKILGIIPLAENLPSGTASRPGDIIKMYSGKTVEILNTDAEGSIILGDALAYAAEKKPEAIIDAATLTGAIIVCLGRHAAGLFSNDDRLAGAIKNAGKKTFERVWEFPVWKEYSDMMKGDFADLKNVSGLGEAGSITAAAFLKEFVGETKWAHLDIAGVEWAGSKHPLIEKGATGTGTRLITQTLIELSRK